jgi:outer membrane protein OmpA-like peptidoglycan-associated protein/outer membrane protein W
MFNLPTPVLDEIRDAAPRMESAMKTRLFSALLFPVAAVATAAPAIAADDMSADAGPYGSLAGGASQPRDQDFAGSELEFDNGGLGLASLGYAFANGLRPELEFAYRNNDIETAGSSSSGHEDAQAYMANLWYDFPAPGFAPRLRPYLGGGAGSASVQLEDVGASNGAQFSDRDDAVAYQGGAGLGYQATRHLVLSVGYRYLETEKTRFDVPGSSGGGAFGPSATPPSTVESRYRSDGVLAGLRYTFGRGGQKVASSEPMPEQVARAAAVVPTPPQAEAAAFETVVLRPVNFQFDRTQLTGPSQATLDELAARLAAHDDMKVLVEGYTDAIGTPEYNKHLGEKRAAAVRDYLVGKGVKAENIELASRGEDAPIADNSTPDGRAANRRAEVKDTEKPANVKIAIEGPSPEAVEAAKPGDPATK